MAYMDRPFLYTVHFTLMVHFGFVQVLHQYNVNVRSFLFKRRRATVYTCNSVLFSVPYDSTKPFVWSDYLAACGAKAVPNIVFKQVRDISLSYPLTSLNACFFI